MIYVEELSERNIDSLGDDSLILIPVLMDYNDHWVVNNISFIYVYHIITQRGYILNIQHNDYLPNTLELLDRLTGVKFIYKKNLLNLSNSYDLELCYWFYTNEPGIQYRLQNKISIYYKWYSSKKNINNIIPIYNFLDTFNIIINIFLSIYNDIELNFSLNFYQNVYNTLKVIEQNGIYVDKQVILNKFRKNTNLVFSEYNLYTSTGRPSNRFGGINFAALPKDNGTRAMIIPRKKNNILIEFDYDSFHIRLASKLIKYQLPDMNLHEYFGRQYFGKSELTEEEYALAKNLSFRLLNGTRNIEFDDIEFFEKIYEYRENLWEEYTNKGYIELPLSKRKLKKEYYENMSEAKLFNYVLQATETEFNSIILDKINTYLHTQSSRLILYTYDSFLIDFDLSDGRECIERLIDILDINGFHVKMKCGNTYDNMILKEINKNGK